MSSFSIKMISDQSKFLFIIFRLSEVKEASDQVPDYRLCPIIDIENGLWFTLYLWSHPLITTGKIAGVKKSKNSIICSSCR